EVLIGAFKGIFCGGIAVGAMGNGGDAFNVCNRVKHSERVENVFVQKFGKGKAGDFFDGEREESVTGVAVFELVARWKLSLGLLFEEMEDVGIMELVRGVRRDESFIVEQTR